MLEPYAGDETIISLDHDEDGGDGDHRPFEHRSQEFSFGMTERVIGVGRLCAHPNCEEGRQCRQNIDDAFEGIGE